jgi:hypothetical protein
MAELSNNEAGRGFTHVYTATYEEEQYNSLIKN